MAGRPPARRSDREYWDRDHRDGGSRHYQHAEYRDGDYDDRLARAGRDHGSWAGEDRAGWDDGRRNWPGEDRRDWGSEDRRDWGGDDRRDWGSEDRRAWGGDDRRAWGRDRGDWGSEDRRAWGGEDNRDWGGGARWAGEDRWADEERPGWSDEDWGWADEDGTADGYRGTGHQHDTTGGAEGNERLTGLTGTVLLVLFAAEGVTLLSLHQLLTVHFFLGMLLIGPVALKAGTVMYRFVCYYTGVAEYRRKGPPAPLLRVLGPVVMITSLSVLGTGIMLAITGPSGAGTWLFLHKASFVLWFGAMTVHVLAYVWRLPALVTGDLATRAGHRAQEVLAGRPARWLLLTASVLTGLLLAVLTVHRAGAWFGPGHP